MILTREEPLVLVTNWTKPARIFFISAPTVVTRTRLCVVLTNALPLFFSNVLNLSVNTRCKHSTYPSATRSSSVNRVWLCNVSFRKVTVVLVLKKDTKHWIHSKLNVKITTARTLWAITQQWVLQFYGEVNFWKMHNFIYRLTVLTKFQIRIYLNVYNLLTLARQKH